MNRCKMVLFVLTQALVLVWLSSARCPAKPNPYDRALRRVRSLSESQHVRLLPFGRSHSGRSIASMVISDFSRDASNKARIVICAGQHGDEYNAVRSVLSFCEEVASGERPDLLSSCAIVVVPVVNPDGTAESHRFNAQGTDINRDWMALDTCEAKYVDGIIRRWKPHVLVDLHEWTDSPPVAGNAIEVPKCPLQSQETAAGDLAVRVARRSGLARIMCSAYSDKRLLHRRYALLGYASYLLETGPGDSYADKDRSYRSALGTIAEAVADSRALSARLSPASRRFDLKAVSAYVAAAAPDSHRSARSAFPLAAMMLGIYCLLVWVMKPLGGKDQAGWSRRFRRCLVEGEVEAHPLVTKHTPHPITLKSWMHRRTRARYAACAREEGA